MFNVEVGRKVLAWAQSADRDEMVSEVGFDMSFWLGYDWNETEKVQVRFGSGDDAWTETLDAVPVARMREGSCKSAACIAGWVSISEAPSDALADDGSLIFADGHTEDMWRFSNERLGLPEGHRLYGEGNDTALHMLEWLCDHPEVVDADDFDDQYVTERRNYAASFYARV